MLEMKDLLKASTVNKLWRQLCFDSSLWKCLDMTLFYKTIPLERLVQFGTMGGRFLKLINLRGCIQLTDYGLCSLVNACPNIQVAYLKDCTTLSTASLAYFLRNMPHLHTLDLSGVSSVRNDTLEIIGQQLPALETLDLRWCRQITGQGVQKVANGCRLLRYLRIDGCSQLDVDTIADLGKLPNLSHLSLASCTSISDGHIIQLFTNATGSLMKLGLSNCAKITDASLRLIALCAPQITHLKLSGCLQLTDSGFCFLIPRLTQLTHLDLEDLQHITANTIQSLANHQPHLRHLCLSNCTKIDDAAIVSLVVYGVCHHLQQLELDSCNITDTTLDAIAGHFNQPKCPRENEFKIEVLDCTNITEKGVQTALEKAGPLLKIKSFYSWPNEQNVRPRQSIGRYRRRLIDSEPIYAASCIIL
ncbi:hypothetical protein BDF14DRAFT_1829485 [Spinellus fusiger]|nr:hypothetical protein BDF14DRAFT_1829485 [Spinellus fusiger]